MEETLRLEFVISAKDIEDAQEALLEKKIGRTGRWLWLTFAIIGLAIGAIGLYLRTEPPYRLYMVALFVVVISALFVFQWWRGKRTLPPTILEIDTKEVRFTTAGNCQSIPWSMLGALVETDKYILVPERKGSVAYVVPKRAFPDDKACAWFRALARTEAMVEQPEPESEPCNLLPSTDHRRVTVEFRLRYRDYLDRSVASWATRGLVLLVVAIMLGVVTMTVVNPPKDAVLSPSEVLASIIPFMIFALSLAFIFRVTVIWFSHSSSIVDQTVTLSVTGLDETSANGHSSASWHSPTCFKETPWSFILWWPDTGGWLLLPKRAFATVDGVNRCREILNTHATRSTWYFSG